MATSRRRNTTHRQRLARAWSAVSGRSYSQALTDIDKLTENNQTSRPLDPVGMVAVLDLLAARHLTPLAPGLLPRQLPRSTRTKLSLRATGTLRVPLTATQLIDATALTSALLRHVDDEAETLAVDDIRIEVADSRAYLHYRINGSLAPSVEVDIEVATAALARLRAAAGTDPHSSDPVDALLPSGSRLHIRSQVLVSGELGWVGVLRRRPSLRFGPTGVADLPDDILRAIERVQTTPGGRVLLAGGTGAGKTTLLYELLRRNASTGQHTELRTEHPVAGTLKVDGIYSRELFLGTPEAALDVSADERTGGRKAGVVGIDEVRNSQVAHMVEQAAEDGAGVLATVHALSAPMAYLRYHRLLHDAGTTSAGAPLLIVSLQAVSTLCPHCRIAVPTSEVSGWSAESAPVLYRADARGCPQCGPTSAGYSGVAHIVTALEITRTMWEESRTSDVEPYQVVPDGLVRTRHEAVSEMVATGLCSYETPREGRER